MLAIFTSVSITFILFFFATLGMAYGHVLPASLHMLWGLGVWLFIVLLQCLVFGFFIGSGKSIKRVVEENHLAPDWIQKTKDYKNQCYPILMGAIGVSTVAVLLGGGVAVGAVPVVFHEIFIWLALGINLYSLWVSYQVIGENIYAIHTINTQVQKLKEENPSREDSFLEKSPSETLEGSLPGLPARYYFLAFMTWIPYLYIKVSLGCRNFSFWPFLGVSALLGVAGFWQRGRTLKR